jgi:hypothetical protein
MLTTLYAFDANAGVAAPMGGLVQATNGDFYGATQYGETDSDGAIFALSAALEPFVKTLPTAGPVGRRVRILGSNPTSVSSVSFNATVAAFTLVSDFEITTTGTCRSHHGQRTGDRRKR